MACTAMQIKHYKALHFTQAIPDTVTRRNYSRALGRNYSLTAAYFEALLVDLRLFLLEGWVHAGYGNMLGPPLGITWVWAPAHTTLPAQTMASLKRQRSFFFRARRRKSVFLSCSVYKANLWDNKEKEAKAGTVRKLC